MRQVREIVRLSLEAGLSTRVVGERVGVGPTTARYALKRFVRAGLTRPVAGSDKRLRVGATAIRGAWREAASPQGDRA
ncbi:Homeodomain-like domain-containing protein [Bradyrhizobium shewense]|uniref:Homeodomain-like domain-containing protein n=1 Tax=Bradyrhizobium shewense TaxID=1761772 RepID=A0A1C3XUB6_9BRAD|nr:helix-turn-helix domain-containing protein [Bradyrhizobium shewense]SCB55842.1 Homeodomain-like domain-containing protein [Bradyrhizobium shewense]